MEVSFPSMQNHIRTPQGLHLDTTCNFSASLYDQFLCEVLIFFILDDLFRWLLDLFLSWKFASMFSYVPSITSKLGDIFYITWFISDQHKHGKILWINVSFNTILEKFAWVNSQWTLSPLWVVVDQILQSFSITKLETLSMSILSAATSTSTGHYE